VSDFHALERTEGRLRVVFHLRVPDANNSIGKSVRSILALMAKPSVLLDISQAEAAALANGALLEYETTIRILGMDEERIQAEIEKVYDRKRQVVIDQFKRKYDWWGAEGSVQ